MKFTKWLDILMILAVTALLVTMITGCAYSGQKFVDESYDEGLLTRKVVGKFKTVAPPFGSKAATDHALTMEETDGDWEIGMGGGNEVDGGQLTPDMIQAILTVLRSMP